MPHSFSYSSFIPPNLLILAALIGVLLAWRSRRFGLWLATAAIVTVYLLSTPLVAYWLIRGIDALAGRMPLVAAKAPPGAIVVLSADMFKADAPGRSDQAGPVTLYRLAEAARLQRRLGLPILVSGGWIGNFQDSLAEVMSRALRNDFGIPVRWREDRSRNTYENAAYSAAILRRAGVPVALVVTQPWHMARSLWSFGAVGYPVVPAPTPGAPTLSLSAAMLLPQVSALSESQNALHEFLGLAWYFCRYRHW
jgi:uncharacterized SAM-binding protein YcdF (DUF218 family)